MTRKGLNFRQNRVLNEMRRSDERRYMLEQIRREQAAKDAEAKQAAEKKSTV